MLLFCRISTGKLPHYRQDQESASKCCLFFDASLFAVAPEAGIALVVVVIADSGMVRDGVVAMAEAVSAGVVLTGGVVVRTGGVGRAVGRRAGLGGMRRAGVVGRGRGVVTRGRVVGGGGGFSGRGLVRRRRSGGEQGQRGHDQRGGLHFLDLKTEKKPRRDTSISSDRCHADAVHPEYHLQVQQQFSLFYLGSYRNVEEAAFCFAGGNGAGGGMAIVSERRSF